MLVKYDVDDSFDLLKMDVIETLKAKGNFLKFLRMQPMVAEQYNNCQRLLTIELLRGSSYNDN